MEYTKTKLSPNPILKANPISQFFFLWIVPLFQKGYDKDLTLEDFYETRKQEDCETLGNRLEKAWNSQLKLSKEKGTKPSLRKAYTSIFWKELAVLIFFYAIDAWLIQPMQPVSLRLLIQSLNDKENNKGSWNPYWYAAAVCLSTTLHAIFLHPTVFQIFLLGMRCRVACSALIYRKALRLSKAAQGQATVGKLVNMLSNDVNRFDTCLNFIPFIFVGPIQLVIFMYFLWDVIGPSSLAGVGFIVLLLPFQYILGKYSAKYRFEIAKRTDERGRIMNEIIVGMRVIKQYAWEKPFSNLVDKTRKFEVKSLKKRSILRGIILAMINFSPRFIAYCTFLVYIFAGNDMTSDTVFFTMTSLNTLVQILVNFIPQAAAGIGEILVTINRIEEFLLLDELQENEVFHGFSENPQISIVNLKASWTKTGNPTLDNLSLNIGGDKLLMVIGTVGSGKTSLLHALLGELPILAGKVSVIGRTSYASQEPWIFAGNVRQNILFGVPYNADRYSRTVKACSLEPDLLQLPHGDLTVVGERGVALSGGQKARINLARALYRKAEIYLMDDPLSAVDAKVSRQLFESCIQEHLKGSLRILVSHQLQYLMFSDHIIVLDQGKILAQGSYKELVNQGVDFVSLMSAEVEDEKKSRKVSVMQNITEKKDVMEIEKKVDDQAEKMTAGSVTSKTYWEYFDTGESSVGLMLMVFSFLLGQVLLSGNDYWLSFWAKAEDKKVNNCIPLNGNTSVVADCIDDDSYLGRDFYILIFTGFNLSAILLCIIRGLFFFIFCTKISTNLHNRMFKSLVRAPTKFFDENPSGRIMNRFTKDIGAIDELLPPAFADTVSIFLSMIGVVTVVIMSNYYLSIPTVFLFAALYIIRRYFVRTARDVKRIESLSRSPLFTHVSATITGITTIRASKSQEILIQQFDGYQNMHSSVWFIFMAANRWFGIWLELISCVFLTFVSFSFLVISSSTDAGNVGLAISSVLTLMGNFQWGMRQSAETENYMTSVERALEYAKLTPEAPLESSKENKPPKSWPDQGAIQFEQVYLAYNDKPVLKNLTFTIEGKQKIGIVGRTGAGKSSIITALFRMTEPTGRIIIDGLNISDIGLHDLRTMISIIPQDPVLFSGTLRYNLDPFEQFEDIELWNVIQGVELKEAVPSLDFEVSDGGSNFSVGQRQLVCLARAILRNNKIIVMDEATANVDPRTDALIQQTIRQKFSDCTIITIAHRLNSVIDCDRILVLDHGSLMEYDKPHVLLQNPIGTFSAMVAQTGSGSEALLRRIAKEIHVLRRPSFS